MRSILAILTIGLFVAPAFALVDDGVNSLGIYFDEAGDTVCLSPAPFVPFNLYFIIAHPISANLGGYEFAWRFDPPLAPTPIILETMLPPGGINTGKENSFIVSLPDGFLTCDATVVAVCNLILLDSYTFETMITVGPATPARIPGHAATYGLLDGCPTVMTLHEAVDGGTIDPDGWAVPGVAGLFCHHGDPVEPTTWGAVKSLFH